MSNSVSVIILTYNSEDYLRKLIPSLKKLLIKGHEVIIVDNASVNSPKELLKRYPQFKFYQRNFNDGFAMGNNFGASKAVHDWLLFLNPDVKFVNANWIENLVNYANNINLDLCGPRILLESGKDQCPKDKFLSVDILGEPGIGYHPFYIEGCALLIKKQVFNELGKFDEKMFMYSEDIDISWRARLYGKRIGISTKTFLIHIGGASSYSTRAKLGGYVVPYFRRKEVIKNTLRMNLKNQSLYLLPFFLLIFTLLHLIESLFYVLILNFKAAKEILSAFIWNFINIKSTLIERNRIQQHKVTNSYNIFKIMDKKINTIIAFTRIGLPSFK